MGLFSRNYERPGPGVKKDEPRKKGAARFFELWIRDFGDLVKLNILFCVCIIPSVVVFFAGFLLFFPSLAFLLAFFISLLLAFPIGGALSACVYYITKMMRDDPSYVWYEFKRKFLENFRQAAPVGMLCTAFIYAQIMLWVSMIVSDAGGDIVWFFVGLFSLLIFSMITPYIYLHFSYISLKTLGILKNSVLMSFRYLPRSFMGALLGGIIWIAFSLYFPISLIAIPFIVIFGITTSMLLCMMWVWKPFDTIFKVEETLIERQKEESEKELEEIEKS